MAKSPCLCWIGRAYFRPMNGRTTPANTVERRQQEYFDAISDEYSSHYNDESSERFRELFFFARLFDGIDLRGRNVLDGMCGSGATSGYVLAHGGAVTGIDISPEVLNLYRNSYPSATAVEGSFLDSGLPSNSFDVVCIIGGLHHLQPNVAAAFAEVHRVLRPGGYFVFAEPPAGTIADAFRKLWYRLDPKYFEDNEAAIDVDKVIRDEASRFELVSAHYGGGPAYFIIFNSLILRVPPAVKKWIATPLIETDRLIERVLPRALSSYVVAQFRKR